MSEHGWDKIESVALTAILSMVVAGVILGIGTMFYRTGVNSHLLEMAMVEKCAAEYRLDNGIYYLYKEYCGGTIDQRIQSVTMPAVTNEGNVR